MLFFANVSEDDQIEWMITSGVSVLQDFIVMPFLAGLATPLLAVVGLIVVAVHHGHSREHLCKQGSVDNIADLLLQDAQDKELNLRELHQEPETAANKSGRVAEDFKLSL